MLMFLDTGGHQHVGVQKHLHFFRDFVAAFNPASRSFASNCSTLCVVTGAANLLVSTRTDPLRTNSPFSLVGSSRILLPSTDRRNLSPATRLNSSRTGFGNTT